jgi:hypothetical protein
MLVTGLLLTLGVIYEKVQYKVILDRVPPGDWRATGERFIDSATQRAVTVYANPKGRRIYVGGEFVPDAD